MHGAIVADALRVPWIPVHTDTNILSFKWQDWCLSTGVEYVPNHLSEFLVPIWKYQKPKGFYPNLRHWAKMKLVGVELKRITRKARPTLSQNKVLERLVGRLEEQIDEFKRERINGENVRVCRLLG